MAVLVATSLQGGGVRDAEVNVLTAGDTFTYQRGSVLLVSNDTGLTLNGNLVGDAADTVPVQGVGSVDVSGGYDFTVEDGDTVTIPLDSISRYLAGEAELSGAEGATAILLVP